MKRFSLLGLALFLIVTLIPNASTPTFAQEDAPACVETYEEGVDYFADKAELTYAEGFTVEYFNNYKVVTVTQPWPGATEDDSFQYVLVQCGTPAPEGFDDATVFEIPSTKFIAMSTTQLPHLVALELLDYLIAVDSFLYINTPEVQELVASDAIIEVGSGSAVNVEVVLDAEPDLVMTYGSGVPDYDAHPVLIESEVPVAINAEWVEASPLARAEWIKYTALFFNAEAKANEVFAQIETEYLELAALTADIEDKPIVLTGTYTTFGDTWNIAGTESYVGQLLQDAGATQVFADDEQVKDLTGTAFFDFETVYNEGLEADFWLPDAYGVTDLASLAALDERYGDFVAFSEGHVYNSDARTNENGGNDIYESGVLNPQLVLADLISIFHPELLPDHELVYYRALE